MRRFEVAVATLVGVLASGIVAATGESPLTWQSIRILSDDHGGAELVAKTGEGGALKKLKVTIRDREIAIQKQCLKGLNRPYLNGISLSYSQAQSGEGLWSLKIPYDGTQSVELESTFNLVFSETALLWSYQSIQVDDRTWEDHDVCPYRSRRG